MARVLVVDDELFYREMVTDVLKKAGHQVIQAEDGKKALDVMARRDKPDVVLTDVVMPGLDGLAVLSKIRAKDQTIPVIMLSAHEDQRMVLQALRRGAFDYQRKPLSPQELVLAIDRALQHHKLQTDQQRKLEKLQSLENGAKNLSRMVVGDIKLEKLSSQYGLLENTVETVSELLDCERVSIMLLDPKDNNLHVAVAVGMSKNMMKNESKPAKKSISSYVLETGKAILVDDVAEDERVDASEYSEQYKTNSFIVAPLKVGKKVVGVVNANDKKNGQQFDEDDLYLLRTMSYQVVATLQLAVQMSEQERERKRLKRLTEFQKVLIHYLEPEQMLHDLVMKCQEMLGTVNASVFLKSDFSDDLVLKVGFNGKAPMSKQTVIPFGESLTGISAKEGKIVLSNNPEKDKRFISEIEWKGKGVIRSLLAAPIRMSNTTIGVIRLLNKRGEPFTREDAELISDVADSLSLAIRNMKLYEQLNASVEEVVTANRNLEKVNDELRIKAKESEALKKMLKKERGD